MTRDEWEKELVRGLLITKSMLKIEGQILSETDLASLRTFFQLPNVLRRVTARGFSAGQNSFTEALEHGFRWMTRFYVERLQHERPWRFRRVKTWPPPPELGVL